MSCDLADRLGHHAEDLVEMLFLDDERRTERDRIADRPHVDASIPSLREYLECSRTRRARARRELNGADELKVAAVDDVRHALHRVNAVLEIRRELVDPVEETFPGV